MYMYSNWKPTRPYRQTGIKSRYKAGVILINAKNEVLLVQNCGGKWSFPKGNIEPFEDAKMAAARELFEETGIRIDKNLLKLTVRHYKHTYFICGAAAGDTYDTTSILDKNEITGIGWFCIQSGLPACISLSRPTERVIQKLHDDVQGARFGEGVATTLVS